MNTDQSNINLTQGANDRERERGAEGTLAASRARLKLICKKLEDRNYEAAEVSRLITSEIANQIVSVLSLPFTKEGAELRSWHFELVKALRILSRQLIDTERLRKKRDVLNWDSQAFRHATSELVNLFAMALKETKVDESLSKSILMHLRDLAAIHEPRVRRETKALAG
jgi:hypothetical protein